MTGSVLITRPRPAAVLLRTGLALQGLGAVIAPVLVLAAKIPPQLALSHYDAVMFSSAAAVRHLPYAQLPTGWEEWPCYCVGASTAQQARLQGWRHVVSAGGDAVALAAMVVAQRPEGGSLLHPCGEDHRAELKVLLKDAGYQYEAWVVYQAQAVAELPKAALQALRTRQLWAATFFSPRSVQIFAMLVHAAQMESLCEPLAAVCLSPQIATEAAELPWRRVISAAVPEEGALLTSLQNLLRQ
jgi:uroporphyrinogen-III synthase